MKSLLDWRYWLQDGWLGIPEWFREWRERGFIHYTCPVCDGTGGEDSYEDDYGWSEPWECTYCGATGWVGLWKRLKAANDWFIDGSIINFQMWRYMRRAKK